MRRLINVKNNCLIHTSCIYYDSNNKNSVQSSSVTVALNLSAERSLTFLFRVSRTHDFYIRFVDARPPLDFVIVSLVKLTCYLYTKFLHLKRKQIWFNWHFLIFVSTEISLNPIKSATTYSWPSRNSKIRSKSGEPCQINLASGPLKPIRCLTEQQLLKIFEVMNIVLNCIM